MTGHLLLTGILQSLGIVSTVSLLYDVMLKRFANRVGKRLGVALVFVVGGVGSMALPLETSPGVVFDLRAVFLVLAGSYGGWVATLATVLATSAFRLWEGGIGVHSGLLSILVAAGVGTAFARLSGQLPMSWPRLVILGVASPASLLSIFVLPWEMAGPLLAQIALPMALANIVGVVVVGEILNRERGRVETERRLCEEATKDGLTGLATRRVFDRDGPALAAAAAAAAAGTPYSVMLIDLDHFKLINDVHGHAAGDAVLRHVGSIVTSVLRHADLVARYGGEEISVVLPGRDAQTGRNVAERVRTAIAGMAFDSVGGPACVTASVGVFTSTSGAESLEQALDRADQALYRAKRSGRNRVVAIAGDVASAGQSHDRPSPEGGPADGTRPRLASAGSRLLEAG